MIFRQYILYQFISSLMGYINVCMYNLIGNNEPVDSIDFDTKVTFNVVQRKDIRVVVVMDVSGSMVNSPTSSTQLYL